MREICRLLEPSLALYAEGELADPRLVRRLRRHLDGCAACRFALAEHDAGTRDVIRALSSETSGDISLAELEGLGEASPDSGLFRFPAERFSGVGGSREAGGRKREEAILAALARLPDPRREVATSASSGPSPFRVLAAAAALFALGLLLAGAWTLGRYARREELADSLGGARASLDLLSGSAPGGLVRSDRSGIEAPPSGVASLACLPWYPRDLAVAPGAFRPGKSLWFVSGGAGPRAASAFPLDAASVETIPRWAVEVVVLDRASSGRRWVLLPEERIGELSRAGAWPADEGLPILPGALVELEGEFVESDPGEASGGERFRLVPAVQAPPAILPVALPPSDPPGVDPARLVTPDATWVTLPIFDDRRFPDR